MVVTHQAWDTTKVLKREGGGERWRSWPRMEVQGGERGEEVGALEG